MTSKGGGVRGFHVAARELLDAGWFPFPLPRGRKTPPPTGLTGASEGARALALSVKAWRKGVRRFLLDDEFAGSNTGIRLPDDVIALDVDDYLNDKGVQKDGWASFEAFRKAHGLSDLPATVRLSSRGYRDVSGQRFYRLVPGPDVTVDEVMHGLPGELAPGVDVLRPWHRYTLDAGSTHPSGAVYELFDERSERPSRPLAKGFASLSPDELPELPADWLAAALSVRPNIAPGGAGAGGFSLLGAEARHAARDALEAWVEESGVEVDDMDPVDLLELLTPAARQAVLAFNDPAKNNSNVAGACVRLLAVFLVDVEADAPVPLEAAIDLARDLYVSHGDRSDRPGEFDRALFWAFPQAKQSVEAGGSGLSLTWVDQAADDEFWGRSEVLTSLRQFAKSRLVSPEAMLACVLVLVASWLPPHLLLPPIVGGGGAGLNFFVALAGASGSGKSSAISAANEWLRIVPHKDATLETDEPLVTTLATGEGLLAAYTVTLARPKSSSVLPGRPVSVQHRRSVRFEIDEIQSFGAVAGREGSTLRSFLKQMWTGSAPSTLAAESSRVRRLESHAFRTTVVAGVQPQSAEAILSDHDGGFPQRWLWIDTFDDAPLSYEELDECLANPPGYFVWHVPRACHPLPMPAEVVEDEAQAQNKNKGKSEGSRSLASEVFRGPADSTAAGVPEFIEITESYRMKIRSAAMGGRRLGDPAESMGEVLDRHGVLLEEKMAALFAALHGEIHITARFEEMAEWFKARSDATRAAVLTERHRESMRELDARAKRQGRSEALAEESRVEASAKSLSERVISRLVDAGGEMRLSRLRRVLNLYRLGDQAAQLEALEAVEGVVVDEDVVRLVIDIDDK